MCYWGHLFVLMYSALSVSSSYTDILRELYFRHIYARVQVEIFPRIFRKNHWIFLHAFSSGRPNHWAAVWELLQLLQALQLHLVRRHPRQPWAAQPVALGDHWRVHLPIPGKELKFNWRHTYLLEPFHLRHSVSSAASLPRRRKTKLRPWKGTLR